MPRVVRTTFPAGLSRVGIVPSPSEVFLPGVVSRGLISGILPSTEAAYVRGAMEAGPRVSASIGFSPTTSGRRYTNEAYFEGAAAAAWLIVAKRNASAGGTHSIVRKDGTLTCLQEGESNIRAVIWPSGSALQKVNYMATASLADERPHVYAGRFAGSSLSLYVDGNPVTTVSTPTPTLAAGTNGLSLGSTENGVSEVASNWEMSLVVFWQINIPSAYEIQRISRNPWKIFAPATRRLYSVPSAAFKAAWARNANTVIQRGH